MKYKILLIFLLLSSTLFAQYTIKEKITEVYGKIDGDFFQGNTELYANFYKLLNERTKIEVMEYKSDEKFPKVSSFEILNKYNASLKHEDFQSIESFNPLKYKLEFFSKNTKVYRIDNTNYILIIEPQL